jgi:carboxymethylenebutenolidase
MKTQNIEIKTTDGICDSYIAYPGNDKYPAVLLYMDAFGPRPYLYEMAQKLAAEGYFVLVPNLFYRVKKAPVVDLKFPLQMQDMPEAFKTLGPLFQTFSAENALRDAGVFLDFLAQQKNVASALVGATGYCMGGTLAIRTAARYPNRIAAAASYHAGNLASEAPDSPHRLLKEIKSELYVAHADNDQSMPPEQIKRFREALEGSHMKFKAELYEGAAHGFTMADLPAYNKAALERHWDSLFDLLDRAL